jgi:hypothetical protein
MALPFRSCSRRVALASAAALCVTRLCLAQGAGALPEGEGREKFVLLCSNCHEMSVVIAQGRSRSEWGDMISTMIDRGAVVSEQDFAEIQAYLAVAFPPKSGAGIQPATGN